MARIRSIHPGFFTDEALVSISMPARLLVLGLGVEADDKGVFEWKPITIKMRIFPADQVDVIDLLNELVSANVVRSYELDGRKYGAIRNFRVFQRPKKPNDVHPITDEIRTYIGLSDAGSTPVPNHFSNGGEISPQMEDVGCRMEDVGGKQAPATPNNLSDAKTKAQKVVHIGVKCAEIIGWQKGDPTKNFAPIHQWLADGATEDVILATVKRVMEKRTGSAPSSLAYFTNAIGEAVEADKQRRSMQDQALIDKNIQWNARMRGYKTAGVWLGDWGPKPEEHGCYVPQEVLKQWGM